MVMRVIPCLLFWEAEAEAQGTAGTFFPTVKENVQRTTTMTRTTTMSATRPSIDAYIALILFAYSLFNPLSYSTCDEVSLSRPTNVKGLHTVQRPDEIRIIDNNIIHNRTSITNNKRSTSYHIVSYYYSRSEPS